MVRAPSLLRRLAFPVYLVGATAALLVAIEAGLRLAGYGIALDPEKARRFATRGYGKFVADPELIWVLRRSWRGREPAGAALRTNSLGLRGPELASPERGARVLFLGDSVTYGHNLEEADTIPARLEGFLSNRLDSAVEVVNAGVPGYSTFQQRLQLARLAPRVAPDLVLLGFCLNDVTERYVRLTGYGGSRFFMGGVDTTTGMGAAERLWSLSALRHWIVDRLRDRAEREERYHVARLWEEPGAPEVGEAWQRVFRELHDLAESSRDLGVPFAVVVYPYMEQLVAPRRRDAPQEKLVAFLRAEGIPALDLLDHPDFAALGPRLFQDHNHFGSGGALVAARLIAAWIDEQRLLAAGTD